MKNQSTTTNVLRVRDVVKENHDVVTIFLDPQRDADSRFSTYHPGQYLTLKIPRADGSSIARCYSLSSSPHANAEMALTVKRVAGGHGSNWLCDNAEAGLSIESLPPTGNFSPPSLDADICLVAAGAGITPIFSILKSVLSMGTGQVDLLYCTRDESGILFGEALKTLAAEFPSRFRIRYWFSSVQGRADQNDIGRILEPMNNRDLFLCGPEGLINVCTSAASDVGFSNAQVFAEEFFSLIDSGRVFADVVRIDSFADLDEGEMLSTKVKLSGQTFTLDWPRKMKLLDVLLAEGLPAPFSCRQGICSACYCVLKSGDAYMEKSDGLDEQELKDGKVLSCQLLPISGQIEVDFDL